MYPFGAAAGILESASHSNVANPYHAAKRRYLLEQQQQANQLGADSAFKRVDADGVSEQKKGLCNTATPLLMHTSPRKDPHPFTVNQNDRGNSMEQNHNP